MEEPIEPSKDDCCNNGCNPCIFDETLFHGNPAVIFLFLLDWMKINIPELTPLLKEDFDFSIIIKSYEGGLVSKYLYNLERNDTTLWRGPFNSYD
ncbi:unnamed protein product, partial [Leptidea sinapis]